MGAVAAGNAATNVGVVYPDAECAVGDEHVHVYVLRLLLTCAVLCMQMLYVALTCAVAVTSARHPCH